MREILIQRSEFVGRGLTDCIVEEIKGVSEVNGGKKCRRSYLWPKIKERYYKQPFQGHLRKLYVSSACYTLFFLVNLRYSSVVQKCCLKSKALPYLSLHWDWREKFTVFRERNWLGFLYLKIPLICLTSWGFQRLQCSDKLLLGYGGIQIAEEIPRVKINWNDITKGPRKFG